MIPQRATVEIRRGTWVQDVMGYAFHVEDSCWFFVPDEGAPEKLFGERVKITLEEKRRGPQPEAKVIRRNSLSVLAETLRTIMGGL